MRLRWLVCLSIAGCTQDPQPAPSIPDASSVDASVSVRLDAGFHEDAMAPVVDAGPAPEDATTEPLPCDGVDCGVNGYCDEEQNACRCKEGFQGEAPDNCAPIAMPGGWIGSPCGADADCDYTDARCQTSPDFVGGHCTLDCTALCTTLHRTFDCTALTNNILHLVQTLSEVES